MNCREGDRAIIVHINDPTLSCLLGRVVVCKSLTYRGMGTPGWIVERPVRTNDGPAPGKVWAYHWIADQCLLALCNVNDQRPDQMLLIAGRPPKLPRRR